MAILKKQSTSSDRNLFYRGELSETTVASLLLDALEERLSGTLTLIRGTVRKVIHLHHGRPVYARSSLRSETLGQMLVNKGLIQPEQHSAALEHSRQQKVPYSEVLFEQGVMKQERIQQEMTENVRQRIETCLHWRSGSWMFIGDEEVVSKVPHCPLETRDLVMDGFDTASGEDEDLEPGEELEEPFMDDEPTPIVDPPEPDKALFVIPNIEGRRSEPGWLHLDECLIARSPQSPPADVSMNWPTTSVAEFTYITSKRSQTMALDDKHQLVWQTLNSPLADTVQAVHREELIQAYPKAEPYLEALLEDETTDSQPIDL